MHISKPPLSLSCSSARFTIFLDVWGHRTTRTTSSSLSDGGFPANGLRKWMQFFALERHRLLANWGRKIAFEAGNAVGAGGFWMPPSVPHLKGEFPKENTQKPQCPPQKHQVNNKWSLSSNTLGKRFQVNYGLSS